MLLPRSGSLCPARQADTELATDSRVSECHVVVSIKRGPILGSLYGASSGLGSTLVTLMLENSNLLLAVFWLSFRTLTFFGLYNLYNLKVISSTFEVSQVLVSSSWVGAVRFPGRVFGLT